MFTRLVWQMPFLDETSHLIFHGFREGMNIEFFVFVFVFFK